MEGEEEGWQWERKRNGLGVEMDAEVGEEGKEVSMGQTG